MYGDFVYIIFNAGSTGVSKYFFAGKLTHPSSNKEFYLFLCDVGPVNLLTCYLDTKKHIYFDKNRVYDNEAEAIANKANGDV